MSDLQPDVTGKRLAVETVLVGLTIALFVVAYSAGWIKPGPSEMNALSSHQIDPSTGRKSSVIQYNFEGKGYAVTVHYSPDGDTAVVSPPGEPHHIASKMDVPAPAPRPGGTR